jgi:predicted deacylase
VENKGVVEIGGVRAERGYSARGFLTIGETATGPIQFPLVVVNGASEGPVLCLTAGVHATEYAPIEAALRIIQSLDAQKLRGTVVAVPVVNMHMFAARQGFVSPIDGLNLNKVAPGANGSITEMMAKVLLEEVILRSQYYVDLHAGDLGEMLMPFAGCCVTGNDAVDREAEALARLFTPELISLAEDGGTLPPFAGSLVYVAARNGVAAILAESGGNATLEEADVEVHVAGVQNIMRYLEMIDGEPSLQKPQVKATHRAITRATRSGLLRLKVKIGDVMSEGDEVAEICNVFGDVLETVRVARGGIAGLVWAHKTVSTGDPIVRCWYTEPAPPFVATGRFPE